MSALKEYLFRILCCGFLVSLCQSIASDERGKRAIKLIGGCIMILVVLKPLVGKDYSDLTQILPDLPGWRTEALEQAKEKNDELLRSLIAAQTEALIRERAEALKIHLEVRIEVEKTADGVYVPYFAELSGSLQESERLIIEQFLRQELNIPAERQKWSGT